MVSLNGIIEYGKEYVWIRRGLPVPHELIIFISNRCNLNCPHCFWRRDEKRAEMGYDKWRRIASSTGGKLRHLHVTGGEPFLNDDIARICTAFAVKNDLKSIVISTNGTLTKKVVEHSESISSLPPKLTVNVSLDSMHGDERAVETIRQLKKKGIGVSAISVMTKDNTEEVRETSEFVKKELDVPFIVEIVRGNHNKPPAFDKHMLELPTDHVFERVVLRKKFGVLYNNYKFDCVAGNYIGVIYSDGSVSVCEDIKPFANLKDYGYDFRRLWRKRISIPKGCSCIHGCFIAPSIQYSLKGLLLKEMKGDADG